jgi:hypothetical protein
MRRRLWFALLFGFGLLVALFVVAGTLPPEGRAVALIESIVLMPPSLVTNWLRLGAHDAGAYLIILIVDAGLYAVIGLGLTYIWDAIRSK